jgi:hypothetical protein
MTTLSRVWKDKTNSQRHNVTRLVLTEKLSNKAISQVQPLPLRLLFKCSITRHFIASGTMAQRHHNAITKLDWSKSVQVFDSRG